MESQPQNSGIVLKLSPMLLTLNLFSLSKPMSLYQFSQNFYCNSIMPHYGIMPPNCLRWLSELAVYCSQAVPMMESFLVRSWM